jgi:isoleucyl-tRNA synthetase
MTTTQPSEGEKQSRYKGTLNLIKTSFAMKANLVQSEPASMKRWDDAALYKKVQEARRAAAAPPFVFHDGPPYANGNIHLGHMLNKSLKDFVVRIALMEGRACSYVPGWDCHGLPIEHKVMQELTEAGKWAKIAGLPDDQRRMAVRRECQKYAEKYVKLQAGQMKRLLTLADYDDPYLTMAPAYEGATLEVFADLVDAGLVYRRLKAVHWSPANETALADAELEYYDREDLSIYVDFEAADQEAVYDAFGLPKESHHRDAEGAEGDDGVESEEESAEESSRLPKPGVRPLQRPCFMIWTTTPWTLPANLAIAVHADFEYALAFIDGNITIVAKELLEKVCKSAKATDIVVIATTKGERLLGLGYRHPLYPGAVTGPDFSKLPDAAMRGADAARIYRVVAADYVTLEDGTGLVHTAPGHGADDYQTGLREKLPIYCPVRENGSYDDSVPEALRGLNIWDANKQVVETLRASGHLFYDHKFMHSYPHDWRGKAPVIFRATEQWFIGVDEPVRHQATQPSSHQGQGTLRSMALDATREGVGYVPEWGRNRMRGMLETRPDWCISRQRSWGLPIPAFYDAQGRTLLTAASVRAVAKLVREKGSDIWFTAAPADLLKHYDHAVDRDAPRDIDFASLKKGHDIFDVWFESGCSWNAVMRERSGGGSKGTDYPIDLYLEGSDQHRGWFQVSLLTSLGATGRPAFKTLLTHGFIVDKDGKKMSKSLGNTLEVEDLLKEFGADVCRWWVATLAYDGDIRADKSFFAVAGESYRKVRNTVRYMLGNLDDFIPSPPGKDCSSGEGMCVPFASYKPTDLNAWALAQFDGLSRRVRDAYGRYDFREATTAIYDFCNDTLSSVYLAAVKDRLYCDPVAGERRRRTQSTMWDITDGLSRLLAPILPHTADEIHRALHKVDPKDPSRCIHMSTFMGQTGVRADEAWTDVLAARDAGMAALEAMRQSSDLDNPLDAGVTLPDPHGTLGRFDPVDLADLLGVSRVMIDRAATTARVTDLRGEPRCERSWKRDGTVKQRGDGGMLSDRDAQAVGAG